MAIDYDALDPGIRDVVQMLNGCGFFTTDSGDGRSKPAEWYASGEALPFPHVAARALPGSMIAEADRMAAVLGDGWIVEASYSAADRTCVLFARRDSA